MTIETTSRDPSTAAEFTLCHAARCKLRHNLPNLFPCPSFCRGYVRLMIHTRISARLCGLTRWVARTLTTFRRTYSTLLRAIGAEFKVMQELMRHSTIRVTLDTYTQAVTSEKHAAQTAVVALFIRKKRSKAA
jgi:integrase